MTTKQQAINAIEALPEEATWEDVQERILFIAGIRKGLRSLAEGKTVSHEQVKKEIDSWFGR